MVESSTNLTVEVEGELLLGDILDIVTLGLLSAMYISLALSLIVSGFTFNIFIFIMNIIEFTFNFI